MRRPILTRARRQLARSNVIRSLGESLWPAGRPVTIRQGPLKGMGLRVPILSGGTHYSSGAYEQSEVQLLVDLVSRLQPKWFCDVGAHVGYYSLLMDELCGGECVIHAFEPAVPAFTCLAGNLARHCRGTFHACARAIGDKNGEADFCGPPGHVASGLQAYRPSIYHARGHLQSVRTTTLDDALSGWSVPPPGIIKVDIEGAEVGLLRGAGRILQKTRPVWLIECHGAELVRAALAEISQYDYLCYLVEDAGHTATFPHLVVIPEELEQPCAGALHSQQRVSARRE